MKYTLGQAAKATGKVKSTISNDIKSGKISAVKNVNGSYEIDASELHRVYPLVHPETDSETVHLDDSAPWKNPSRTGVLDHDATMWRELFKGLKEATDRERLQWESQVNDLQTRLDVEGEERRKLTAILTDQRKPAPVPSPAETIILPDQTAPAKSDAGTASTAMLPDRSGILRPAASKTGGLGGFFRRLVG